MAYRNPVAVWLDGIGLAGLAPRFENEGYEKLRFIQDAPEEEIDELIASFRFGRSLGQKLKHAWAQLQPTPQPAPTERNAEATAEQKLPDAATEPPPQAKSNNPLAQAVEGAHVLPPGDGFSFSQKFVATAAGAGGTAHPVAGGVLDISAALPQDSTVAGPSEIGDEFNEQGEPVPARSSILVGSSDDSDLEDFSDDDERDEHQRFHDNQDSFSESSEEEEDGVGPLPPSRWPKPTKNERAHGQPVLSGGKDLLAAENELLREQLAQAQAALAAREKAAKGGASNPLQFRPRPELELPPLEAPSLFDDGTLNLMAAAGDEARTLYTAASQRDDNMPQWVAAPGGVTASTADAIDSVLAGALHAEAGAAAFLYDDVATAVDSFEKAAKAAYDTEDAAEANEALAMAKEEQMQRKQALLSEGKMHLDAKHWREAVLCLEMAEQTAPDDAEVKAAADKAREARDFVLNYRNEQAIAAFHEKRFADSEGWFDRALSIAPSNDGGKRESQMRAAKRHATEARKAAASKLQQLGAEAFVNERYDEAIEKFYKAM